MRRDASGRPELVLFDPAFAGKTIPALLGEVKATFHNIFAHPLWLYTPDLADKAFASRPSGVADAHRRHPRLGAWGSCARQFLALKRDRYWRPLLRPPRGDAARCPATGRTMMRSALFCCPTLVMSQLPGPERSPSISLLGFAVSTMCGSDPERRPAMRFAKSSPSCAARCREFDRGAFVGGSRAKHPLPPNALLEPLAPLSWWRGRPEDVTRELAVRSRPHPRQLPLLQAPSST